MPSLSRLRPVGAMQPIYQYTRVMRGMFYFCVNTSVCQLCNTCHSSCLVLQFLKDISKHTSLPRAAVAPVLAISLKQDLEAEDRGMSAVTSDLLSMWKQASPKAWMQQLTAEAASTLAVLLTRDQCWSEAAAMYEIFVTASQVARRQSSCGR